MSLNTLRSQSATPSFISNASSWQILVVTALIFWLSSSLVLDTVVMPSMYASGMMETSGFATAGYSIFWVFNRVEVLSAGLILTGVLALKFGLHANASVGRAVVLAGALMAIATTATYVLTPQMGALGIHLSPLEATALVPASMNVLHGEYFGLEILKFAFGLLLLRVCAKGFDGEQVES
ncbi:MAG: hypothetical protein WBA57_23990 [Elainellaceae cyanobacterium]